MSDWKMWEADGKTYEGPLPDFVLVEVMMVDGETWDDELAGAYNWGLKDEPGEIIAYRLPVMQETERAMKTKVPA